jgi:hypothetical protein
VFVRGSDRDAEPPLQHAVQTDDSIASPTSADDDGLTSAERKRLNKQWAELLRHIYEVDPLLCSCGAQMRQAGLVAA